MIRGNRLFRNIVLWTQIFLMIGHPALAAECPIVQSLRAYYAQFKAHPYADPVFGPAVEVEIQGYVDSISRSKLNEVLVTSLKKLDPALEVKAGPGGVVFNRDGRRYKWDVKMDGSINAAAGPQAVRVVSPTLRTPLDVEEYLLVMQDLKKAGFKSEPLASGTRVHVDFSEPSEAELDALRELVRQFEDEMSELFSQAKKTKGKAVEFKPLVKEKAEVQGGLLKASADRDRLANQKSIVEFGVFNSTVDSEMLEVIIDFSGKYVQALRSQDPRLLRYLEQTAPNKVSLRGLAKALDMKLGDAEPVMERIAKDFKAALKRKASKNGTSAKARSDYRAEDADGNSGLKPSLQNAGVIFFLTSFLALGGFMVDREERHREYIKKETANALRELLKKYPGTDGNRVIVSDNRLIFAHYNSSKDSEPEVVRSFDYSAELPFILLEYGMGGQGHFYRVDKIKAEPETREEYREMMRIFNASVSSD